MVALVGADGAGKTTVARRLEEEAGLRFKYIYMGENAGALSHALPTTRLHAAIKRRLHLDSAAGGPPDPRRREAPRTFWKRSLREAKSLLRLAHQLADEWYRQGVAWRYARAGYTVVFDRHFYADRYAHDIRGGSGPRGLSSRIHGFLLEKLFPRPDLVILLDAPTSVLFARKPEGSVELVERRRLEYFQLAPRVPRFEVVDADRPPEAVTREVLALIKDVRDGRRNRPEETRP